jgi:hypothetical protein
MEKVVNGSRPPLQTGDENRGQRGLICENQEQNVARRPDAVVCGSTECQCVRETVSA